MWSSRGQERPLFTCRLSYLDILSCNALQSVASRMTGTVKSFFEHLLHELKRDDKLENTEEFDINFIPTKMKGPRFCRLVTMGIASLLDVAHFPGDNHDPICNCPEDVEDDNDDVRTVLANEKHSAMGLKQSEKLRKRKCCTCIDRPTDEKTSSFI